MLTLCTLFRCSSLSLLAYGRILDKADVLLSCSVRSGNTDHMVWTVTTEAANAPLWAPRKGHVGIG
jgi:hypothetical protein